MANLKGQDALMLAARAVDEMRRQMLASCFDPDDLKSRPTAQQQAFFDDIGIMQFRTVFGGNRSGKSACPAREIGWILTETHPTWKNPWNGPLLILIAAQDLTGAEAELWRNKISKFVDPADYREIRQGQTLKRLVHKEKGHQIIFLSHGSSSDDDIKHLQMYTAHYVWVDEAPKNLRVLEELFQRVSTTHGYFVATMTLKARDHGTRKVREYIENICDGVIGRIYRFSRLLNPKFKGHEANELRKVAHLSPEMQRAVLEGDPLGDDLRVWDFDEETTWKDPVGYRPQWRHVNVVDPATESKLGQTVWAEDPATGHWYCVIDDYIEGIRAPSLLVAAVEKRVEGLNVVKRIYDTAEGWFAGQARLMGYRYVPVRDKGKKDQMRANLQEVLGSRVFLSRTCTRLREEFETCSRSDTGDGKIVNESKYHLLDTARYFWDGVPRGVERAVQSTEGHDAYLIRMDDARRRSDHEKAKAAEAKKAAAQRTRWRSWRSR